MPFYRETDRQTEEKEGEEGEEWEGGGGVVRRWKEGDIFGKIFSRIKPQMSGQDPWS